MLPKSKLFAGLLAAAWIAAGAGCSSSSPKSPQLKLQGPYPKRLSDWGLFSGRLADLRPASGVIPYDLNTPLFSDYATKFRTVWVPPGTKAVYDPVKTFTFPAGTVLSKSFSFDGKIIETRLLVNSSSEGWVPLPYIWKADQSDAVLEIAPDAQRISYRDATAGRTLDFDYVIPNVNQCKNCHENAHVNAPVGPRSRHLNRNFTYADGTTENQLAHWAKAGILINAPENPETQAPRLAVWNDPSTGSLEARARAYLDINCAHCHNPQGPGNTSGLNLSALADDFVALGRCKTPVAAGRGSGNLRFAILPGKPEESILIHRMASTEPKVLMPELGRSVVHEEGVALIRNWIKSMSGSCDAGPLNGTN